MKKQAKRVSKKITKQKKIAYNIKMSEKTLKFVDVAVNKKDFHAS